MSTPCNYPLNPAFHDNTCSSVIEACFSFKQSNSVCSYVTGVMAFHAARGVMMDMFTADNRMYKYMLAELDIALVIKPGSSDLYDNPVTVSNMYFNALARPNCLKCYSNFRFICSNQIAIQLAAHSDSSFPPHVDGKDSIVHDTICTN